MKTTASSVHSLMCLFDFVWYDLPIIPGIISMGYKKMNSKCTNLSGKLVREVTL